MSSDQLGTVFLVGAGPGDPDLLTVKAQKLISKCDALVYDSLIPLELLDLVPENCKLHSVGKRRGHHSVPQRKTNHILFDLAKSCSCVVRLKGGDPFLFGRGAEEASYLHEKGVPVQIVPGITSGIAAPAYVGIPITHRLAGSSVTFVTGHEGINKNRPAVNWRSLAKSSDGLVIYMGVHNLSFITAELIAGGMNPEISAAVIEQGTVIGQRFIKASLINLFARVQEENLNSPSIVVIGSVVDFQVEACSPKPAEVTFPIPI
tara:strand:- start:6501 stop:7286 length:786 start_codon:yes stop_codon:yes gene_type:complete